MTKKEKPNEKKGFRRANGTGSVYELKGNRRNPFVAVSSYVDEKGIQQRKVIGYAPTRTKATILLDAYNSGSFQPADKITLKELYDEWIKNKKMSDSSRKATSMAWNYIKTYQSMRFADLRAAHLQYTIDEVENQGKGYSTAKSVRTLWTQLYKHAIKNDISVKDYSKYVDMPKETGSDKSRFTDAEIKRLFTLADQDPYVSPILIMIYTGLRIGELMQLTRFNVDIDKMVITGGIKTDAGRDRIIPIHKKIQPFIRDWYNKGGDALIINKMGKPMTAGTYRENYFKPIMKDNGFREELTPHSCRHTFASMLAANGVDTVHIQKLIGHTDYALTANVYTHPEVNELKKAIGRLK